MDKMFCPRNCKYLNITEEQQQAIKGAIDWIYKEHRCRKYNVRVFHLSQHPDLYRCAECYKENVLCKE